MINLDEILAKVEKQCPVCERCDECGKCICNYFPFAKTDIPLLCARIRELEAQVENVKGCFDAIQKVAGPLSNNSGFLGQQMCIIWNEIVRVRAALRELEDNA